MRCSATHRECARSFARRKCRSIKCASGSRSGSRVVGPCWEKRRNSRRAMDVSNPVHEHLRDGRVIPAHPLALDSARKLDERRQRGLTRYYIDAGAGGIAVGVHTTQFAIRDPAIGLYRTVLELAVDEANTARKTSRPFAMIAGVCGHPPQALAEAELAASLGYHAGLLSLGGWREETEAAM